MPSSTTIHHSALNELALDFDPTAAPNTKVKGCSVTFSEEDKWKTSIENASQGGKRLNSKIGHIFLIHMNTVVILCGANSCGKTTTLKGFFGIGKDVDSPKGYIEKEFNGKIVCALSFSSPQEQVKVFCKFEKVQENIKNRLKICDEKAR